MKKPTCNCAQKALAKTFELEMFYEDCEQVSIVKIMHGSPKDRERNVRVYLANNFCPQCGRPYESIQDPDVPEQLKNQLI